MSYANSYRRRVRLAHRPHDGAAERFGVGTKSGGIDAACEFSNQMLHNLEQAAEHPDMTEDLAEVLLTANVTVEYRLEAGLEID